MALDSFAAGNVVTLTSTLSSQTTTVPGGGNGTMMVQNNAANTVYLKAAATIALPVAGTWTTPLIAVGPSQTQTIANPLPNGGTLAYIAEIAGGGLVLSIGEGVKR